MPRSFPRHLLTASAAVSGIVGLTFLFLPLEVAGIAGLGTEAELPIQLMAGGFLALAVLDWAGRGAVYGGIYGRPLILSNFAFGVVTGGSLASAALDGRIAQWGWIPAGFLLLHALLFGTLMRSPPWTDSGTGSKR
jgi:hypothetical protein